MEFIQVVPFNDLNNPPIHHLSNEPFMYIKINDESQEIIVAKLYDKTKKPIFSDSDYEIIKGNNKFLLTHFKYYYEIIFISNYEIENQEKFIKLNLIRREFN